MCTERHGQNASEAHSVFDGHFVIKQFDVGASTLLKIRETRYM